MSDMIDDPKVRRLIRKHGALGYSVYNLVIERIAKRLTSDSPIPDLEETAEDLTDLLNSDTAKIQDVLLNAMQLGLFDYNDVTDRVTCVKLYKFIEKSQTRNGEIRAMIDAYKEKNKLVVGECPGLSETNLIEESRVEESRVEKNREQHPTLRVPMNQTRYENLCSDYGQTAVDTAMQQRIDWENAKGKPKAKDYAAATANWLAKGDTPKLRKPKVCPECKSEMIGTLCISCGYEEKP